MTTPAPVTAPVTSPDISSTHYPVAARTPLPAAGPAWYSAVMGTGILSTLLTVVAGDLPGARAASQALLVLGWVLLLSLTAAFLIRAARDRQVLTASVRDSKIQPLWGTVSMGVLAIGSASLTVLPTFAPTLDAVAVVSDAILWTMGTLIGLVTAFGFTAVLIRNDVGHPSPLWGLPIVPPMVSATTGAALLPHLTSVSAQFLLLVFTIMCFFLALSIAVVVFAIAYHHHWRISPVPLALSPSTWIPLGIVGQSTAAAQAIATQTGRFLAADAANAAHQLANTYGLVMLAVAVPVVAYAVKTTASGFAARLPFTPGWWALTFPVGTLSLGAHLLGTSLSVSSITALGGIALAVLVGTWTLCTAATVTALTRHQREREREAPRDRSSTHQPGPSNMR